MKKLLTISILAFASLTANATAYNDLMEIHKEAYKLGGKIGALEETAGLSAAQKAKLSEWRATAGALGGHIETKMRFFPGSPPLSAEMRAMVSPAYLAETIDS